MRASGPNVSRRDAEGAEKGNSRENWIGFGLACGLSPITNHQSPITNRQSPIANHQSPIANHQSPIANHQSPIANHQSPITNHQSPITNHQSQITNHKSPIANRRKGMGIAVRARITASEAVALRKWGVSPFIGLRPGGSAIDQRGGDPLIPTSWSWRYW
jgi:peptidoglycan hydrolase CwlO-like protein